MPKPSRRRGRASTAVALPEVIPRENVALKAFAHGNTYLAEGKFAEATAALHQARELEPKHPHIATRLAEAYLLAPVIRKNLMVQEPRGR